MNQSLYEKLLGGGGYSLPYLIHIWDDDHDFRFVNDNRSSMFQGETYSASNFTFLPSDDGDSTLEIAVVGTQLLELADSCRHFNAEFIGVLKEGGEIYELRTWKRKYGKATWNGGSMTVNFASDDRLKMMFPSLIYNSDNNRGLL